MKFKWLIMIIFIISILTTLITCYLIIDEIEFQFQNLNFITVDLNNDIDLKEEDIKIDPNESIKINSC